MKRIVISLSIIAIIIAVGIAALFTVSQKNDRLYGHIESVLSAYKGGRDASPEIAALCGYFENDYAKTLSAIVDDDRLAEMAVYVSRLEPMLQSGCDEFEAECSALRAEARKIYLSELPLIFRIL